MAVDCGFLADDLWVGTKTRFPVAVAEHGDGIGSGSISLGRQNQPALRGSNAEHREEVPGNERRLYRLGFSIHRQAIGLIFESCEASKNHSGLIGKEC